MVLLFFSSLACVCVCWAIYFKILRSIHSGVCIHHTWRFVYVCAGVLVLAVAYASDGVATAVAVVVLHLISWAILFSSEPFYFKHTYVTISQPHAFAFVCLCECLYAVRIGSFFSSIYLTEHNTTREWAKNTKWHENKRTIIVVCILYNTICMSVCMWMSFVWIFIGIYRYLLYCVCMCVCVWAGLAHR